MIMVSFTMEALSFLSQIVPFPRNMFIPIKQQNMIILFIAGFLHTDILDVPIMDIVVYDHILKKTGE